MGKLKPDHYIANTTRESWASLAALAFFIDQSLIYILASLFV